MSSKSREVGSATSEQVMNHACQRRATRPACSRTVLRIGNLRDGDRPCRRPGNAGWGWCCERGLNSRPLPYQGSALPLSYRSAWGPWPAEGGNAQSAAGVIGAAIDGKAQNATGPGFKPLRGRRRPSEQAGVDVQNVHLPLDAHQFEQIEPHLEGQLRLRRAFCPLMAADAAHPVGHFGRYLHR